MRPIFFFILLSLSLHCQAQVHNHNWFFGENAGISFLGPKPKTFAVPVYSTEGVVTVSHPVTGAIIFYTNGRSVYNKNYMPMPNGIGFNNDTLATSAQGVVVIPFFSDTNKYYLFSVGHKDDNKGHLTYTIVDKSLNGGLGDVVPGKKGVVIDTGFSEAMSSVEGCENSWLVTYKPASRSFYTYKMDASGLDQRPVVSPIAVHPATSPGTMSMKILLTVGGGIIGFTAWSGYVSLHSLSTRTGAVYNSRVIDTAFHEPGFYSCEFSTNGRRLYVSQHNSGSIYQYDINHTLPQDITATKKLINRNTDHLPGALQMGPDGDIYIARLDGEYLDRISDANELYPKCIYTVNAIRLAASSKSLFGLPQRIILKVETDRACRKKRRLTCARFPLVLHGWPGVPKLWHDGSTRDSFTVRANGTYWVTSFDTCLAFTDTVEVDLKIDTLYAGTLDTNICPKGTLILNPNRYYHEGTTYKWNTSGTNDQITVSAPGKYWRSTFEACRTTIDSFIIGTQTVSVKVTNNDTTICKGDTILLSGTVSPLNAIKTWSNGDTGVKANAFGEGRYALTAEYGGCKYYDFVDITTHPGSAIELGRNEDICIDKPLTLPVLVSSPATDEYLWQDGSRSRTFTVSKSGVYHVTLSNRCGVIKDTVTIAARHCNLFFPSAFSPNGDGRNDIARLTGDVANVSNYTLHIYNRQGQEVYAGNDVNTGWNGMHKGQPAAQTTYYYYMNFKYLGNDEFMKGDLTLLK
jgi:gliding motility-associated-like protein